jgi:hypothetical protein
MAMAKLSRANWLEFGVSMMLFAGAGGSLLANFKMLDIAYQGPLNPDPVRGLVVPINNHGTNHFMTRDLSFWIDVSFWCFFSFFVCLFALTAWRRWFAPETNWSIRG